MKNSQNFCVYLQVSCTKMDIKHITIYLTVPSVTYSMLAFHNLKTNIQVHISKEKFQSNSISLLFVYIALRRIRGVAFFIF